MNRTQILIRTTLSLPQERRSKMGPTAYSRNRRMNCQKSRVRNRAIDDSRYKEMPAVYSDWTYARTGTMSEVTGTLGNGGHSFNSLRNKWMLPKGNFTNPNMNLGSPRPMENHSTETSLWLNGDWTLALAFMVSELSTTPQYPDQESQDTSQWFFTKVFRKVLQRGSSAGGSTNMWKRTFPWCYCRRWPHYVWAMASTIIPRTGATWLKTEEIQKWPWTSSWDWTLALAFLVGKLTTTPRQRRMLGHKSMGQLTTVHRRKQSNKDTHPLWCCL